MVKKILLTGSNGFLGQHIVNKIGSRNNVLLDVFSFREDKLYQNKIDDLKKELIKNNYEYIINAGSSQNTKDNPESLKELVISNILFPSTILSIIDQSELSTHFINFGSSWEFCPKGKKMPFNAYAASKTACESFFSHYAQKNFKITNLYLYDTYGPNDKRNKVINLVIDAMIKNENLNMSGCEQVIDLIFIDDVINSLNSSIVPIPPGKKIYKSLFLNNKFFLSAKLSTINKFFLL